MANPYYNHGTQPVVNSLGVSSLIRTEFDSITTGFGLFPTLAGNANRAVVVNAGGTALTVTVGTLALAGNLATTGAFNTTFAQQATVTLTLPNISSTLIADLSSQGQIWGLNTANDAGDLTNDIAIGAGVAGSNDAAPANVAFLVLSAGIIKRLDATWVTGTNQGGRSSSVALANTTYHVFIIRVAGVDDVGFDTSITAANLIADHAATKVRRIASIVRTAGAIALYVQNGSTFALQTPIQSVNTANPGIAAVTATLSLPTGVVFEALINAMVTDSTPATAVSLYVSPLNTTDVAPTTTNCQLTKATTDAAMATVVNVLTNTSAQVRYRISASVAAVAVVINTLGWRDERGRTS